MISYFLLGTLRVTEEAKIKLKRIPLDLIARHAVCEHGDITGHEQRANANAKRCVGTILSRYPADPTDRRAGNVLVITNESWDETVVQLEE